jgi:hypothetical protein
MTKNTDNWHFARPALAEAYLKLFDLGLTAARGLFARRRMGKTEFLKKDFIPVAQAHGYVVAYTNLWDLEMDPATALISEFTRAIKSKKLSHFKLPIKKITASGKILGIGAGSVEADLTEEKKITGTLLMEAMRAFDRTKIKMILVIDEAQVLAYAENSHFAHALRAALDIRKERIKVIFAGSSEATLRRMFGVSSEPFYNWAPLEPFELLGENFVAAMVDRVNNISKFPLALKDALIAFTELKNTPEFFRRYIEHYLSNPMDGSQAALTATKSKVFNDDSFKRQWDALLPADKVVLSMVAKDITDLYGKAMMQQLGNKNTIHNAIRRLTDKNIITKIQYGVYQFEDEAYADWVRHSLAY